MYVHINLERGYNIDFNIKKNETAVYVNARR